MLLSIISHLSNDNYHAQNWLKWIVYHVWCECSIIELKCTAILHWINISNGIILQANIFFFANVIKHPQTGE